MDLNYYDQPCKTSEVCRSLSLVERLEAQRNDLTNRLAKVDEALAALKEHPEVMKVLELVSKV